MTESVTSIPKEYVHVGTSAPINPFEGQIWVDTSSGNATYQYKSSAWASIQYDADELEATVAELQVETIRLAAAATVSAPTYDRSDADAFTDSDGVNDSIDAGNTDATYSAADDSYSILPSFSTVMEDFEDITDWTDDSGSAGTFSKQNTTAVTGYAGQFATDGANDNAWSNHYSALIEDKTDIGCWFRFAESHQESLIMLYDASDGTMAAVDGTNRYYDGEGQADSTETWNDDAWYFVRFTQGSSATKVSIRVYNSSLALVFERTDKNTVSGRTWASGVKIGLQVKDDVAAVRTSYIDDISDYTTLSYSEKYVQTGSLTTQSANISKIFVYAEKSLPSGTSMTVDIDTDDDGTFELTDQALNDEISVSAGTEIRLKFNLKTTGSDTPTLSGYSVLYWT